MKKAFIAFLLLAGCATPNGEQAPVSRAGTGVGPTQAELVDEVLPVGDGLGYAVKTS